jgi:hypothetical protein
MAEIYVRAPDGTVGTIDESEAQAAAEAGYQVVSQEDIRAAQRSEVGDVGAQKAAAQGLLTAPDDYSRGQAFGEKALSAATFGQAPGLDTPGAIARGNRYQAEHPYASLGAEVAGQLPLAIGLEVATGGLAGAVGLAGRGLAARGAFKAGEVAVQGGVGGAQTEAEQTRLAQDDFSWTDAAVTGLAGEVIGRGAALGFSSAIGASRNLIARATRQTVAEDAASSLTKGGILNDFRVAHHAEQYQNELSTLAADDLDKLETSFQEVSRQDRKRARIVRVVEDNPEAQAAVRAEAQAGLADLYDALAGELGDAPGPAKHLLKQLDERMEALGAGGGGKKLWRVLDENRQALQEYAQDLHQAYENAPGSAWLSREGLGKLDAAEKATREALLREDVWGAAAAREQAAYNVPFHEKYFPTSKTVRGKLMQSTGFDSRGFPVYRGDPGKVKAFLTRGADDVDSARLGEQFRDYLDGVAAIARTAEKDTPAAARETLEAVRRLRKATANAEYIAAAAKRSTDRGRLAELGVEAVGAGVGVAALGPLGGAATFAALRGARTGDFLLRAARKLGWGAGEAEDMAALLGRDALPAAAGRDAPVDAVDDLLDSAAPGPRSGPPSGTPPSGAPGAPPAGPAGGGGGLTPSMRAEAARGSWRPSVVEAAEGGESFVDELAPEPTPDDLDAVRPGREARAATPTAPAPRAKADPDGPEPGLGRAEALELEGLRETTAARRRDDARVKALTEGEFAEVVRQLEGSASERAQDFAVKLRANLDSLRTAGLVVGAGGAAALAADDQPEGAAGAAVLPLALLSKRVGVISKREFAAAVKQLTGDVLDGFSTAELVDNALQLVEQTAKGTEYGRKEEAKAIIEAAREAAEGAWAGKTQRAAVARELGVDEFLLSDAPGGGFGTPLSGALGSNEGGWYKLADGGSKAYVKFYAEPAQAVSEHAANKLYGKSAPETQLFVDADGRVAHVSYDVNPYSDQGVKPDWAPKALADVTPEEAKVFVKDFWKDVLLANWDVVGLTGDNLVWRAASSYDGLGVKRLDNGSALRYRAQGAEKPAGALGKLTEIEGFFNKDLNPNYAGLLRKAGVTSPYEMVRELHQLLAEFKPGTSDSILHDFSPEIRNLVRDRVELLRDYANRLESPRLRQLRENIGASRRLGAGFRGDDGEAFDLVESFKGGNESLGKDPGARALEAPPELEPAVQATSEMREHPGLNRLIEVSKARVDQLTRTQRKALDHWVATSRSIRNATSAGLDALAETVPKYSAPNDPATALATAAAFNSAMEELTVVNPTKHGPLFRFIDLNDRALAELLQKDDFVVSAPTSTGYIPDPNFGSTQFRFRKVDSAGALIGRNITESEMILLAESRFRKVGQYWDPEKEGFVFDFEEVPETTKSPVWGDLGHLSLGPVALAAGALADPDGAVEDGVAAQAGVPAAPAAGFGAAAALFRAGRGRIVRDVAKRLFSASAEPTLRTTARLVYSREQLAARSEEFHTWQQNPNALVERVAEGLRDAPPEAFSKASTGVFAAAAFLREKLPQSAKPSPVALRGTPVSAEASAKYARYEQAALRPGEAVREGAESGYLSPELLETLQTLYPDLLAELRVEAYDTIRQSGGAGLSIQAKAQYARLFDGDGSLADPAFSPTAVQMVNMAYEEAAQVSPAKTGTSPRPGVSQMAVVVAAPQWGRRPA